MHLFELTSLDLPVPAASVPGWALGCFRRRSITFFSGEEETGTEVLWLQSRGLTADFRRPPTARGVRALPLTALTPNERVALARVEAGLAQTRHDGELMHWSGWASFQTHARWPEPGRLRRVGNCLIEFAPSGAYVEDWRFEPAGEGPLIGLRLLDEREARSGVVRHRGGGLIVCGHHAAFVRGRPEPLPEGERLERFVRRHAHDAGALAGVFSFDAAYGQSARPGAEVRVTLANLPWRKGSPLLSLEGFSVGPEPGLVTQRCEEDGLELERRFAVDTLERHFGAPLATDASAEAAAWLERERDALLP